ncbi:uncharacterized protein MELLADRAFT_95111 [Melampsora larici-populina 98AG31]|uniref:T-cell immunomodulatory protein TIP C2 domain-containing protein n=1 Tax=Melampsora larici-populina (strain 98AG31 / pathotype 3-4-7) TaxID=747676 RepID=F4RCP7_MELLP|nr:uncharacterized protein MELLADRAFT_95111 [Melampsora larici-populina 98AG31]EGG09668.1 hypothetical protein MELLADRAFT_95111 [Melampsora larici-populina 98AG31]
MRFFYFFILSIPFLVNSFSWNHKKFKSEGLINLDQLGLETQDGHIIALGDSNADQFQDLFILSQDQRSIHLYLWNRDQYQFLPVQNNPIISHSIDQFIITNIILTDINYDGRLDVLVMGSHNPSGAANQVLKMEVCYGLDGQNFAAAIPLPSSLLPHPLAIDSQGTMKVDLLGLPSSLPSVFKLWRNQANAQNTTTPFDIVDLPFNGELNCNLPNPHSNSFIDLDGDCLADIFLTCEDSLGQQTYQIWINHHSQGFSLSREGLLPKGTKHITFADVDRDGTIDMIFATCPDDDHCSIHVAYNQQIPLCKSHPTSTDSNCRDPQNLCTADPKFEFSFESSESAFSSLPIDQLFPEFTLVTKISSDDFLGTSPVSIQTGDFDLDGFPDLLIMITQHGPDSSRSATPQLLRSIPCSLTTCTSAEVSSSRRTFEAMVDHMNPLTSIQDAKSVFFMDIDEDGTLDLVVQRAGKSLVPTSRSVTFIKNNFFNDAFFLKAMLLNGACETWCPSRDGQPRYRPYGVNFPGASYKFTIQDTFGTRRATAVGQIPFHSYPSPTTPYSFFGLGRTNNYVESLFVGSTRTSTLNKEGEKGMIKIEGVLPNSELVVNPFGIEWLKEVYLLPGDWIPWVMISLMVLIFLLGLIVGVLHFHEKRDDERERRKKAHKINFDAL